MSNTGPASPFLVGRDAELAQITAAVDGAPRQGGTVRIAGNPGVGKSALLRTGMDLADTRGYTVLSVRAAEGESHLAFAALYQLMLPLLGRVDKLPAGHRAALKSAFGLAEPGGGPDNPFFIALAALELIADAAAETPVFIGVDDLSWLDEASLDAIEFISRRITDEQVVYARAALADDDRAEALFADASRLKAGAPPWYRARVDLAYGSWLRRQRRVAESRQPLASVQAVFDALGAGAWSARAIQELAATGRRSRQHEPDAWAKLSAQELQVAQLAAQGLTNREIGERLYLSHRTVSSHLYRLFPKLGVRSRNQLHLALDSDAAPDEAP